MLVPGFFPAQLICKRLDPEASKYAALLDHKTYPRQNAEIEAFFLSEQKDLSESKKMGPASNNSRNTSSRHIG